MNRRNLFKMIAAIPLLGRAVPASALQEPSRKPINLAAVRDLLRPGLRSTFGDGGPLHGVEPSLADIQIDYTNDRLLVKAGPVTGIISRADIQSGCYKAKFCPLLLAMGKAQPEKQEIRMEEIT